MPFTVILSDLSTAIASLPEAEKILAINQAKKALHEISPFRSEPVDCVIWVKNDVVHANDWNPNHVAPVEMELLKVSILQDGYTQPIVTCDMGDSREVVDGFHRTRVAKECEEIRSRVLGYAPVVTINSDRVDRNDRIAATIRHNRARGKHQISSMSDIVIELKKRNWSDNRICKELGMDEDEVLRLCQISGLVEVFSNSEFSEAWEAEIFSDDDFDALEEEDIS